MTIERPLRLRAQFNAEAIENMIFDSGMAELSRWLYEKYGEKVFSGLVSEATAIRESLQNDDIKLTDKQLRKLIDPEGWKSRRDLKRNAEQLAAEVGNDVFMDYNQFIVRVTESAKKLGLKLSKSDLDKKICRLMAVADPKAEPVIAKIVKSSAKEITELVNTFGIDVEKLHEYGFYPAKKNEYIVYESDSELRDTEKIPVKEDIYEYFLREVRPYVADAWINLPSTKIGCEISFNKYFYQPKPLRTLAENEADILALDAKSQGFIKSLFNHPTAD